MPLGILGPTDAANASIGPSCLRTVRLPGVLHRDCSVDASTVVVRSSATPGFGG